jgi:hypothetical protein
MYKQTTLLSTIIILVLFSSCGKNDTRTDDGDYLPVVLDSVGQDNDSLVLNEVQKQTMAYFWDFGHPVSGMARERNSSGDVVTTGGTGFGVLSLIAGVNRNFLGRDTVASRLLTMCKFLKSADRFHGAWPHWLNGRTGKVQPFSSNDNGADLVETAFLIQGLLTARMYFNVDNNVEAELRGLIDDLWQGVEWDWFTRSGQKMLYWHWSPDKGWAMNMPIRGWNEALIVYVLAASSPTHPVSADVYHNGWAQNGLMKNGASYFGIKLPLGVQYGGPMFFAHYSFLCLDPRNLVDKYANYWEQNVSHAKINWTYSINNPKGFGGYSDVVWGLTASDDPDVGYQSHAPYNFGGTDNGTISPTAAIASIPYLPQQSLKAINHFHKNMYDMLWGMYGFKDAFNLHKNWVANSYLAIDQGPIVVMIENYRTGLLWNTFMKNVEIQQGLTKLGFTY